MSTSPHSTNPEQSLVGTQLDKYQIHAEIGRGGMGAVYKAYDPTLDRFVALKVLAPHLVWEEEFVERFLREARAAARLKHPNIVTIYDVGRAGGWYYFTMDYVEGRALAEIIQRQGAVSVEEALRFLRPLADALDYAHDRGLIHRDVKPGNIIVDAEGDVTLTDFGIARAAQAKRLTRTGAVMGTPEYMAPEQASGDEVDRRTDQYALGVVAYELLAGRAPFRAESTPTLLYKIVHDAPPPLRAARPDLPEAVGRALARALSKRRQERYTSCGKFVDALEQATMAPRVEHSPRTGRAMAPASAPITPPAKRQRDNLLKLGGIGLAAIGLLCVAAVVGALMIRALIVDSRDGSATTSRDTATPPALAITSSPTPSPPATTRATATTRPTATPRPSTPTLSPTDTPASQEGNILLQDDFDDPRSGWEVGDYEEGSVGYKDGVYSVTSVGNAKSMWGVANHFFTDLIIEVEATQVSAGPADNNDYGVGCRIQSDGDGYYLIVSGDGYYGIWMNYGPDWVALQGFTESDVIRRGNASNHIRAVCDGANLALYVNGQHLATVEDTTFTGGDVALAATSYEDVATEIVFDDLVVYAPAD